MPSPFWKKKQKIIRSSTGSIFIRDPVAHGDAKRGGIADDGEFPNQLKYILPAKTFHVFGPKMNGWKKIIYLLKWYLLGGHVIFGGYVYIYIPWDSNHQ